MKLIRELRWGPPKSFKTGATVGTYPKPLLYLGFDVGGLDVIPSKIQPKTDGAIPFDISYEDITFCEPGKLGDWLVKPEQPKVLAVDYTTKRIRDLSLEYMPSKSQEALQLFQGPLGDYNKLCNKPSLPWKTIVLDCITGYMEVVLSHFSSLNPGRMADARDWAFQVGQMVKRVMTSMTMLPAHVVVLMHDELDKNDLSMQVNIQPYVFGREVRAIAGGLFSQYFHAQKNNGKPVILTSDQAFCRGVGSRWPILTGETQPDFKSIYGKEL